MIYLQGDPGAEMFRILSGSVRMSVMHDDGKEVVLGLFEPGDCFGDSSVVDGGPRPQTTMALEPVELQVLDTAACRRMGAEHPSFNTALLRLLARQMRGLSEQFALSSLDSLAVRIANRLVITARSFGVSGPDGIRLNVKLSQSELAAMVGASRQSVSKLLLKLQAEGVVRITYGGLVISDLARLERLARISDPD